MNDKLQVTIERNYRKNTLNPDTITTEGSQDNTGCQFLLTPLVQLLYELRQAETTGF